MSTTSLSPSPELFVKMIISDWDAQNSNLNKLIASLSDEQLMSETAPGRNTGIYLLGHLVAVADAMIPILGWGKELYPELYPIFVKSPDKSGQTMPSIDHLKKCWVDVQAFFAAHVPLMKTLDWFEPHTLVSQTDFEKEPHRNKLNIMISRANHTSYHRAQMAYLKK